MMALGHKAHSQLIFIRFISTYTFILQNEVSMLMIKADPEAATTLHRQFAKKQLTDELARDVKSLTQPLPLLSPCLGDTAMILEARDFLLWQGS